MLIFFNAARNPFIIEIIVYFYFFILAIPLEFKLYLASILALLLSPQTFIFIPICFYWINVYTLLQDNYGAIFIPIALHLILNVLCVANLSIDVSIFIFYLSSHVYVSILLFKSNQLATAGLASCFVISVCLIVSTSNSPEFLILYLHAFHTYSLYLAIANDPHFSTPFVSILSVVSILSLVFWYSIPSQILSTTLPVCKLCEFIMYNSRIYTTPHEFLSTPEAGLYYQALYVRDYSYMLDYTPHHLITNVSNIVPTLFSQSTPLERINTAILHKGSAFHEVYSIDNVFYSMNILLHSKNLDLIAQYYVNWRVYYEQISRDDDDKLIVNQNGTLRHFGFMNDVILDGKPLFVSLLMYNTLSRIIEQYPTCPHKDEYISTLQVLKTSLAKFRKSPKRPWYSACIDCTYNANTTDVWGTMYMASLNLTTMHTQNALERSLFTVSKWGGIPHVLHNESWTTCRNSHCAKQGMGQNGGYWAFPYAWVQTFVENKDTLRWIKNNLDFHMRRKLAPQWINEDGTRSLYNVYATTCTSIYAVFNCST